MLKIFVLAIFFSTTVFSVEEIVNAENIDSVSRSLIGQYFNSGDKIYDRMKALWVKSDKTDEVINALKGQDLQFKSKAIEYYGLSDKDNIVLVGSKALPIAVKVVYVIEVKLRPELVPFSLTWLAKDGAYKLLGVNWGMSQCKDDLSDLSITAIGSINGPLK